MKNEPPAVAFGEIVRKCRIKRDLTQMELAELVGYKSQMSISKIENGAMVPPAEKVAQIAAALGNPPEIGEYSAHGLAIARVIKSTRSIRRRRAELIDRQQSLEGLITAPAAGLEEAHAEARAGFLEPFFLHAAHVKGLEQASTELAATMTGTDGKIGQLDENFINLTRETGRVLGLTAGGGAVGVGSAAATYAAVSAFATASTGTAISTLGGAAAGNATLAFLGGGSLAAGGFGVVGGTAVLTGIVMAPALIAGAIGVTIAARRILAKAHDQEALLDAAEEQMSVTEARTRAALPYMATVTLFLNQATEQGRLEVIWIEGLVGARGHDSSGVHIKTIEPAADDRLSWKDDLTDEQRTRLAQALGLVAVTMSVMPLPVIVEPDAAAAELDWAKRISDANDTVIKAAFRYLHSTQFGISSTT